MRPVGRVSSEATVRNLTLRFSLGRKNTRPVFVFPHSKCRPLKEGIYVDAKTTAWLHHSLGN